MLANLRKQMLIAIGIPACWTGTSPPPPAPPPAVPRANLDFDASECPRDTLAESVCGERRASARGCGARGSNLSSVEEFDLHVSDEDSDEPGTTYRDFVFDRGATRIYRDDDPSGRANDCCYSRCTALTVGTAEPTALGYSTETRCMPAPPNGTSAPAAADPACPIGVAIEGTIRPYVSSDEGQCCYTVPMRRIHIHSVPGRALRIDGVPHVAGVTARTGWDFAIAPDLALDAALRARLAAAWLTIAQLEHASIAAFASLALRLLAAGAPPELIRQAHEAALDEVRHAQIAFALASAYSGTQLGPDRFDAARRAVPLDGSLRAIALETFVDGCIGETAAAYQAELMASSAQDPAVAAALAGIAEDEARHGALAWAIVGWCVREGVVSVAELAALATARVEVEAANEDLAAHGVLGDQAATAARAEVLREIVGPCLQALAA